MSDIRDLIARIPADAMTAEYALVTPSGGVLTVEGDIGFSSALSGCVRIETSIGAVYIDEDAFIDVVDLNYNKAHAFQDLTPRGIVVNDALFAVDDAKLDGFGPNGELFMRVECRKHVFNFGLEEYVTFVL